MDGSGKAGGLLRSRPRSGKQTKNFACRMDAEVFGRLEDFVRMSGQSKTKVVELALDRFIRESYDGMERVMRGGPGGDAGGGT